MLKEEKKGLPVCVCGGLSFSDGVGQGGGS